MFLIRMEADFIAAEKNMFIHDLSYTYAKPGTATFDQFWESRRTYLLDDCKSPTLHSDPNIFAPFTLALYSHHQLDCLQM